jgi:hypothetical protein
MVAVVCLVLGLLVPSGASAAEHTVANVISIGILALPVCIGVAVLRYRLYEIDQIISRTLAYTIVTGLLIGVYAGLADPVRRGTDRRGLRGAPAGRRGPGLRP